jgi:hypothetical protein
MTIIIAVASTVAEPVNWVSHHTNANWATLLPIKEKAWPVQITKNGAMDLVGCGCASFISRSTFKGAQKGFGFGGGDFALGQHA